MCIRKKFKQSSKHTGQDLILGQFVYIVIEDYNVVPDDGTESLTLRLGKVRINSITYKIDDKQGPRVVYGYSGNYHVVFDSLYKFSEDEIGKRVFVNIDDAIRKAGEIISKTCFGKEVDNEEKE